MKASIWGWAMVVIGIVAIFFVYFFQNISNTDEHNYNLLKDVTEAAMLDAVDLASYAANDVVFMDGDKFVESFVRRFAESATLSRTYVIKIYDVSEIPPKVSLQVSSLEKGNVAGEIMEFDITNRLDAILESPRTQPIILTNSQQDEEKEKRRQEYIKLIYKDNPVYVPNLVDTQKIYDENKANLDSLNDYFKNNGPCKGKTGAEYDKCLQELQSRNTKCSIYDSNSSDYQICIQLDNEGKIDTKCSSLQGSNISEGITKYYDCIRGLVNEKTMHR